MWNNYGITFIEYVFLKLIRENNDLIKTVGADILNRVTSTIGQLYLFLVTFLILN